MDWYIKALKKYADFNGRSQRSEYWFFTLVNFVISLVLTLGVLALGQDNALAGILSLVSNIYSLAVLIPGIAVGIRRLHDTNRSGWWLLIAFIPCVGAIILLVYFVQDSDPGDNQFGPNPKLMN